MERKGGAGGAWWRCHQSVSNVVRSYLYTGLALPFCNFSPPVWLWMSRVTEGLIYRAVQVEKRPVNVYRTAPSQDRFNMASLIFSKSAEKAEKALLRDPSWCKTSPSLFGHRQTRRCWDPQMQLSGHQTPSHEKSKEAEKRLERLFYGLKKGKHAFHLHYNTKTFCRWFKQIFKHMNTLSWDANAGLLLSVES